MTDAFESLERATAGPMDRRRFLQFTGALAGATAFCQLRGDLAQAAPPLRGYPFALGVASGDPAATGAVLWTRLVTDVYEPDGGMPHRRLPVAWRLSKDPGMRHVVRRGVTLAAPELAHSVHVEVAGLDPRREYFFQFRYRDELSPVGRTFTAPARRASVGSLAFAFASCQRWDDGYYSAYRRMAEEDLDVRASTSATTSTSTGSMSTAASGDVPVPDQFRAETTTLERYRLQYALYKSDPDLRRAHHAFPWVVTWDDHEVENDYAGVSPRMTTRARAFSARRAAAYQAFYEHLPLRSASTAAAGDLPSTARFDCGDLAEFSVLDTRQYRTDQPCGDGEHPRCPASLRPGAHDARPRAGATGCSTGSSDSRGTLERDRPAGDDGQLDHERGEARCYWHDAWDGYPPRAQRIFAHVVERASATRS